MVTAEFLTYTTCFENTQCHAFVYSRDLDVPSHVIDNNSNTRHKGHDMSKRVSVEPPDIEASTFLLCMQYYDTPAIFCRVYWRLIPEYKITQTSSQQSRQKRHVRTGRETKTKTVQLVRVCSISVNIMSIHNSILNFSAYKSDILLH